ncbi:MAG TPA: hypothetical protein VJ716_06540, partial [Gaiellaceae bacterium]|nr:hypothetical protein [Gaiellaceae bacterium]
FVPPPGARRISRPRHYAGVLRRTGPTPLGEVVDAHRFWRVRKPLKAVIAFLRAHRLHGFAHTSATWGKKPHYLTMSSGGVAPGRFLNVTSVGLRTRTLIRVDVQVEWTYPRSPAEKVPAATRTIAVRSPRVSLTVTDPAKVARIIRWFDALPVSPPGIVALCPLPAHAQATLSFRSAGGIGLAQASVPLYPPANLCSPIGFTIQGKREQPLIDSEHGRTFIHRLQSLLGRRFVPKRR